MAVLPLKIFPDDCLARPSHPITQFNNAEFKSLIQNLTDTLYASPGVGLAAPQIGVLKCVSVIDVSRVKRKPRPFSHGFFVMVNPVLIHGEGEQIPREGCLSVPDLLGNVRRFEKVTVKMWNELGEERLITSHGFEALALQHEIDHLQGRLFLDRIENFKTDVFQRKQSL